MALHPDLHSAQIQHRQGDIDAAINAYQDYLEKNKSDSIGWHLLSIAFAQQFKCDQALEAVNKAIELQNDFALFYNTQGNIYLQQKNYPAALKSYEKALNLDANYAIAINNRGNCLYYLNDVNAAKKCYQQAIELDSDYADAHYNYGRLLLAQKEWIAAKTELELALLLNPNHFAALGQLAQWYMEKKEFNEAEVCLKKRLELAPHHAETHYDLGITLYHLNRFDDALYHFGVALDYGYKADELHFNLANTLLRSGDSKKGLQFYLQQLEQGDHLMALYNIGVLLMDQSRQKEAIDYFKRALEMDVNYLPAHLNLASCYLSQADTNSAILHYEKALQIKPDDVETKYILDAMTGKKTPDHAPDAYLQHLFDHYAKFYDQHLGEFLQYRAPELLQLAFINHTHLIENKWRILDLGCGTGLCGERFKEFANTLIGVDISEEMLNHARVKNIYDELIQANIIHFAMSLSDEVAASIDENRFDIILAADVFSYFGKLDRLFSSLVKLLKKGGYFGFTVEKAFDVDFVLNKTMRYSHNKKYIEKLLADNLFHLIVCENVILRKQQGKNVEGYLFILRGA